MFNNSTNAYIAPRPRGHISHNTSESITTYKVKKTANHTEISIMKSQWDIICKKINKIKNKSFNINLYELIIGAIIPYVINIITDFHQGKQPEYFPILICMVLLVIAFFIKKVSPFFHDNSVENNIHLNDIKDIISEINKETSP